MVSCLHCIGFSSGWEFNTYVTFVFLGMAIMMVTSAITSAPAFVTEYYRFATGIPDAEPEKPFFWEQANTFYNVGTYVSQVATEILCLSPIVHKIPLKLRLYVGLVIPFLEMLVMIVVPAGKIPTQDGAIAVLMAIAVLGGFAKALIDSTTNALVGPFPTKFMNGAQWGLTVIALFMSIIQIILKASMPGDFYSVLNQSRIYFGIAMAIQAVAFIEMVLLVRNPFARKYIAEFRSNANKNAAGGLDEAEMGVDGNANTRTHCQSEPTAEGQVRGESETMETINKLDDEDDEDDEARGVAEAAYPNEDSEELAAAPVATGNAAIMRATGDADRMHDADQDLGLTSNELMARVSIMSIVKRVWPMLFCAFLIFFTSLFLFPGLFFKVDPTHEWFGTIIVLLFNVGDFVARIVLMIRQARPSPKVVLAGTFARIIIIVPLLVLCVRHIIPGHWMPYILITLVGGSGGYFGTAAVLHCPRTPTLTLAGERSRAAMLAGVAILLGLCAGSNCALALNLTI